jgi:DNA (cytosine-5)-methyltransferase 1
MGWNKLVMTHASLFSGIGGFDLAAHWAGYDNVFACEIDEFCQKVLRKNFKDIEIYEDIKKFDATKYRNTIDVLSGSPPCQGFSVAGDRKGSKDDRHLWPEMYRIIREINPAWVITENVRGLTSIENGEVLQTIYNDLENAGYETQAFLIPALSVNSPHKRERIWIISRNTSDSESMRNRRWGGWDEFHVHREQPICETIKSRDSRRIETSACSEHSECGESKNDSTNSDSIIPQTLSVCEGETQSGGSDRGSFSETWRETWIEAFTRVYGVDDGISTRLDKYRNKRIKACGNSIIPQIAYEFLDIIYKLENRN